MDTSIYFGCSEPLRFPWVLGWAANGRGGQIKSFWLYELFLWFCFYKEMSNDWETSYIRMWNNLRDDLLQATHHITEEAENKRIFSTEDRTDLRKQLFWPSINMLFINPTPCIFFLNHLGLFKIISFGEFGTNDRKKIIYFQV